MVTFKLKEENDQQLVYWYFPHGNEENGHGTIVIDRVLGKLDVTELAPDDRLVRHTVENQNRWRKAVNQMRNIEQIPELTDEEWPEASEDRISTVLPTTRSRRSSRHTTTAKYLKKAWRPGTFDIGSKTAECVLKTRVPLFF